MTVIFNQNAFIHSRIITCGCTCVAGKGQPNKICDSEMIPASSYTQNTTQCYDVIMAIFVGWGEGVPFFVSPACRGEARDMSGA